jgi:hypothetical protein
MMDLAFKLGHQIVHEAQSYPATRWKRTRCQQPDKIGLTQAGASVGDFNEELSLACRNFQTDLAMLTGCSARIEEEVQDDLPDGRSRKTCQACQSRFDIPMQPLRAAGNLGLKQQLEVFKVFRAQSLANAVKAVFIQNGPGHTP